MPSSASSGLAAAFAGTNWSNQAAKTQANEWFANRYGLRRRPDDNRWRPVRANYISEKANRIPRLDAMAGNSPTLGVAVIGANAESDTRDLIVEYALRKVLAPVGKVEVLALCSESPADVLEVVGDPAHALVQGLLGDFPQATLTAVAGGASAGASRGPMPAIPLVPLIVNERVLRMIRVAVASSPAVMLVGPPGTGKSALVDHVLAEAKAHPERYGLDRPVERYVRVTAEEAWTFAQLVGGQTVSPSDHNLVFRPGFLLEAVGDDAWLVLEEANRADLDKIFGGLLTWLADQDVILDRANTSADSPAIRLSWDRTSPKSHGPSVGDLEKPSTDALNWVAGTDWRLIGTYNALDAQRVFRMGNALSRRFVRVPVPPMPPKDFARALSPLVDPFPEHVRKTVAGLYAAHHQSAIALGPALFFRCARLVCTAAVLELGFDPDGVGEQGPPATLDGLDDVLCEAYVSTAGTWLAHADPDDLIELRAKVVDEAHLLTEAGWTWLETMLTHLG